MTTIGKDLPVRSDAFRFNSEKRASSAATSPARTECFDIFSPEPGESDVISQMERLSSKEIKIAARLVWMAVGASCRSATVGMIVSRVGVRNLTLSERWSLSTSPWDLSTVMVTGLSPLKARVRSHPVDHLPLVTALGAVVDIIHEAVA